MGTGDAEARARIETITAAEMIEKGVTLEMAVAWRDYYLNEILRKPQNPTARGRVDPMQYVAEILAEQEAEQ